MKTERFNLFYIIKTQFSYVPLYSGIVILEHFFSGVIPALKVIYTAMFLDISIQVLNKEKAAVDIVFPLLMLMFLIAYGIVIDKIMRFISIKMKNKLRRTYRLDVVDKQAQLKYKYFENPLFRDLISRVCELPEDQIMGAFFNILSIIKLIINVVSVMVVFITQVWWAATIVLAISIPLFFLAVQGGKQTYEAQRVVSKYKRRLTYLSNLLTNCDATLERSLFNYNEEINKRWLKQYEIACKIEVKAHKKWFIRMNAGGIVTVIISIFVMIILINPVLDGTITVGMFISLITSLNQMVQMMSWQLTSQLDALAQNREFLRDLKEFSQLQISAGVLDLPTCSVPNFKKIEFINVSFTYPGTDKVILNNISFTLENGKHYAFVGGNGAGKTTIIKLITGLYDEFKGEILIDGQSIKTLSMATIKALCAVVYQDFSKYAVSFKDNILMGDIRHLDSDFGMRKLKDACEIIGLDNVIAKLPKGIDTYLGKINEEGMDLSGGEWQRIAIARAITSTAPLIILDEPTASLDPISESQVYHEFEKVSKNRTTIFISHRLASTKLADEIIVISDGAVIEQGTHEELMKYNGVYCEMYDNQRSWYL